MQKLSNKKKRRLRELQQIAKAARKEMAKLLYPTPSEEPETRKQSNSNAKSTRSQGDKRPIKRKAGADTNDNFKKVCLCLEVSTLVAGLPLGDLEAAKAFVERLRLKNQ